MARTHKRLAEAVEDYLRYRATRCSPVGVQQEGGHRVVLMWTAGLGYLVLVMLLTWQALRGQSVGDRAGYAHAAACPTCGVTPAAASRRRGAPQGHP
jgi:hypothetical protein